MSRDESEKGRRQRIADDDYARRKGGQWATVKDGARAMTSSEKGRRQRVANDNYARKKHGAWATVQD